ncbi:MAG: hypothetical protein JOZ68_07900, partial [Acidimicrobiia bacterium]|nr:hypothetical protein [Acidimicrobiia bacterium]
APAGNPTPTTPLISIQPPGALTPQIILKTQDLFGPGALPQHIDIPTLASISIGEDPRAIGDNSANPAPPSAAGDGTLASGAVDVVRIKLLVTDPTSHLADLRIGHMESKAQVPAGGVNCPAAPVQQTTTTSSSTTSTTAAPTSTTTSTTAAPGTTTTSTTAAPGTTTTSTTVPVTPGQATTTTTAPSTTTTTKAPSTTTTTEPPVTPDQATTTTTAPPSTTSTTSAPTTSAPTTTPTTAPPEVQAQTFTQSPAATAISATPNFTG